MKINFKNIENGKDKTLNLEDILLSANNPRYKIISSKKNKEISKFISKNIENLSQQEIANELLTYEGNLKDFLSLSFSIKQIGFDNINEPILIIHENGKYFVAEGNRRILLLKLICNLIQFNIEKTIDYEGFYENEEDNNYNLDLKLRENQNEINYILKEIKLKYKEFDVYYKIAENDKDIWQIIYDKHITGEKPGVKKWSRGKYFADLLYTFPKGIDINNKDDERICLSYIKRDIKKIVQDYRHAQFVFEVFKYGRTGELERGKIFDEMKKNQVSAIEPNFSIKRIRDYASKLLILDKEEIKKYFDYEFYNNKKGNLLKINDNNLISKENMFKFIYKYTITYKIITTRGITDENTENKFKLKVMMLFKDSEIKSIEISEKISNYNIFDFDINMLTNFEKQLNEIIENNPENSNKNIKLKNQKNVIRTLIDFKYKSNSIVNKINKKQFSGIFNNLLKQYILNNNSNFYNAVACSIRTFFELIFIYSSLICEIDINKQDEKIEYFSNENIKSYIDKYLMDRNIMDKNIFDIELVVNNIKALFPKISKKSIDKISSHWVQKSKNILNSFIHKPGFSQFTKNYSEEIMEINSWLDIMEEIVEFIENDCLNKFIEIDKKIYKNPRYAK